MPYYSFRDRETGEIHTEFLTMSQLDEYKIANPGQEQVLLKALGIGEASRFGVGNASNSKPPSDFRDLLKYVKKNHHKSNTINTF